MPVSMGPIITGVLAVALVVVCAKYRSLSANYATDIMEWSTRSEQTEQELYGLKIQNEEISKKVKDTEDRIEQKLSEAELLKHNIQIRESEIVREHQEAENTITGLRQQLEKKEQFEDMAYQAQQEAENARAEAAMANEAIQNANADAERARNEAGDVAKQLNTIRQQLENANQKLGEKEAEASQAEQVRAEAGQAKQESERLRNELQQVRGELEGLKKEAEEKAGQQQQEEKKEGEKKN